MSLLRDAIESLSTWRAAGPHSASRRPRCVLCVARRCGPAPGRRGGHARIAAAASASQPPCPSSAGRGDARRRPINIPAPPCVARRAGGRSAMHQLGELLERDTGIEPHERRQRDLEDRLVIPGEGGHRPGWLRSTCGCPTTRTYQSVRAQTWLWLGCAYQASSTSTSRLCLLVGAAGGARPRGAARRRFLSGGRGPRV